MSYRTHGDEEVEYLGPGSAAATPYTPSTEQFFPSTSPNPDRQYGYSPYSEGTDPRPNIGPHRVSDSTIRTQSTTQHISSQSGFVKSRYTRTLSNLSKTEEMLRKWSTGVHWYVPTALVVVFLLGCLGALGHHLFYNHLDGKLASNQLWMMRYGTFLAFCTKAALVGATVLAYRFVAPLFRREYN
jgi:hypothetical protein